ncbi:putative disease resistance protein RGA3 [Salvia hispanica]|uniref:putative disease resistance protein RGA3 n=1 Tax=Salvia hispanica TaxID=49212 RepID=UPI0020094A40|nr:putative disease resistance protein RGA3 [Salvia hispanica]XP_047955002.1 putative disease resistance protein RGA3 [Salvia hispanica]
MLSFLLPQRTNSIMKDPIFVGREDDVSKVVDMLTHIPQDRTISIVALVGMGGMGKTTLTRNVFNHLKRLKTFESYIWVHVSQNFDPISLYNTIHSILTSTTSDRGERVEQEEVIPNKKVILNEEVILKKLQEALKAKTYLLVLDDVWNEDVLKWEDFIKSIEGVSSKEGNGIIITTRSHNVASIVNPLHTHPVKGLSHEECWSIIKRKNFDGNAEVPSGFEKIGKEIAKRCQGLPLAANVAGDVLRRRKSMQDWSSIKETWLSDGKEGKSISTILKLSYDHLPSSSLKKCFAYYSIFPKGQRIMKEELIELWIGEGFLQPGQTDDGQTNDMESVGNTFLNVLLENSLLQATEPYIVMHDLVHDLASSVLHTNTSGSTVVRYMFHENESSRISEEVSRNLRTLILVGGNSGIIFSGFKSLHNLTLSGENYKELPSSIKELIHLRNLNISMTSIGNIPEWIGELHHLQTLRAEQYISEKLPNTLKYLINLRHLYLRRETGLPAEIRRLTNLQTLLYFTVGEEKGYQIEELGSLKNLKGTLEIEHLDRVRDKEEAMKANLSEKSNLSELVFSWAEEPGTYWDEERRNLMRSDSGINDESVLEGLQPHANLKVLKIERFKGKKSPRWLGVWDGLQGSLVPFEYLTKLTFEDCSECEEISTLESLPSLKYLYLSGLIKLKKLPKQLFYKNRDLSKLEIRYCPKLRGLPDGLDTLIFLEELIIWNCGNLISIGNPSGGVRQHQGILRKLDFEECRWLKEFPCQILESFAPTIEILKFEGLRDLQNLPMLIDCLAKSAPRLEVLKIRRVSKLMAASASGGTIESWSFGSLKELNIDVNLVWRWDSDYADAIRETVDGILQGCRNSLTRFTFKGIDDWEWLPQSIQHLTTIDYLRLEDVGVKELPQWLGNLSSLTSLHIERCKKLRYLPPVAAGFTNLKRLQIYYCPKLKADSEWRNHPNLKITCRRLNKYGLFNTYTLRPT